MRRRKASRPATAETVNRPRGSQAGERRNRKLDQDDYQFQGFAVYGEEPFRCIGHLISRGRDGYAAYDADDHALGTYPDMKAAADAISAVAESTRLACPMAPRLKSRGRS